MTSSPIAPEPHSSDDSAAVDGPPRPVWRALRRAVLTAGSLYVLAISLVPLLVGAVLISGAWQVYAAERDRRADLEALSGRAEAAVETAWWRLDVAPGTPSVYWYEERATAEACARLRFRPEGDDEVTTVLCRRHRGLGLAAQRLTWEGALGPGVVLPWVDAEGMPEIRIRLSERTARWIRDQDGPSPGQVEAGGVDLTRPLEPATSPTLERLWRDVDDPFLHMLREWSRPAPTAVVAYRPEAPSAAVPLAALDDPALAAEGVPVLVFAGLFGLFGAGFWGFGWRLLTWRHRRLGLPLFLGSLGLLLFAADRLGPALGRLSDPAGELLESLPRSVGVGVRPEVRTPGYAGEPGDVALDWSLARSYYGPVLEPLGWPPPPAPMDDDELLAHLAARAATRLRALDDAAAAAVLRRVTEIQSDRGQGEELGLLFLDAALELRRDPDRAPETRAAARGLLRELRWSRPSDNPYRLAAGERVRLLGRIPAE